MRRAATRRPLLTGLALGVIAAAAWWLVKGDGTPRIEPGPIAANRAEGADDRSGDATKLETPAEVIAADRQLARAPSRSSTRALLKGFVVDREGRRAKGAAIQWRAAASAPFDYKRRCTATSGEYALPGLPAAVVRFRVTLDGYAPLELALDLAKGGALRHDFVVDRSVMVAVHVTTPDGTPIQGNPTPNASWNDACGFLAIVATDAPIATLPPISQRSYERRGVGVQQFHHASSPGRRRTVEVPAGAFGVLELPRLPLEATLLFKHVVIDHRRLEPGATSVAFTFDPSQLDRLTSVLRLTLVDGATGDAIDDAHVAVYDSQSGGPGAKVADDGTFEQRRIPPGWMGVTIDAPGRARWYRNLLFEPGTTLDLGEIELPAAITLQGTLVGSDGKPAMAQLSAWPLAAYTPGRPFGESFFWAMEKAGEWQLPQLGPGLCQIQAFGENDPSGKRPQRAWRVVDVAESPAPLALQLQSTVKVVVDGAFAAAIDEEEAGAPIALPEDCIVDVVRSDGFVAEAGREALRAPVELQLLAGSYVCAVRRRAQLVRTVTFDVGDRPLRVRFSLDDDQPPEITPLDPTAADVVDESPIAAVQPTAATGEEAGLTIEGRVVDEAGAPVDGARVSAVDDHGDSFGAVLSAEGDFVVVGLRPARYELLASADGCRPARAELELAADATPEPPTLVLRRMTRIDVTLVDPGGQPLKAAYDRRFDSQLESDVTVVATASPPPDAWPRASFSRATWKPKWGESRGTLDLRAPPPLHACVVFAGRVIAALPIEPDTTALRFTIDLALLEAQFATLRMRLVDAITGDPITRAFAGVSGLNGSIHADPSQLPEIPDGVHELERLLPGRRQLCITLAGRATHTIVVDLPAGGLLDLGDVELLEPIELHGVVVDEHGAPLKIELRVVGYDAAGDAQLEGSRFITESDALGRFTVTTSQPRIRLQPNQAGSFAIAPLLVDVAAASVAKSELRFALQRGHAVTLRSPSGDDSLRRVALRSADGELLSRPTFDGPSSSRVNLAPGDYRVVVERDGRDAREIAFSVADGPMTIELP